MDCVAMVTDSLTVGAEILRSCKAALVTSAQRLRPHRAGEEARLGGVSRVVAKGWMCRQIPSITVQTASGCEGNVDFMEAAPVGDTCGVMLSIKFRD